MRNPECTIRLLREDEALRYSRDPSLPLDPAEIPSRFSSGWFLLATLEDEELVGFDWYAPTAVNLEDQLYFCFDPELICSQFSFVRPEFRGRRMGADRWDFADHEFSRRGWRGTVYFVEIDNRASLRSSGRRRAVQWIGIFAYMRIAGRYVWWTSPGCRRHQVRLKRNKSVGVSTFRVNT